MPAKKVAVKRSKSKSGVKKVAKKATSKGKPAAESPLVDPALKTRWNEAIARYRESRADELEGWDERYEALGEIIDSDPPYYLAGGHKTARAFLAAEAPGQDERTVRSYIRVARYFDPEDEAKHGITKLSGFLDYLEAAGGAPLAPAKINLAKEKVRVGAGKAQKAVSFDDASTAEIREAARTARSKSIKPSKFEPPLVKAVRAQLGKAGLGSVGVRLRQGKLDLGGIDPAKLAQIGKALAQVRINSA